MNELQTTPPTDTNPQQTPNNASKNDLSEKTIEKITIAGIIGCVVITCTPIIKDSEVGKALGAAISKIILDVANINKTAKI